MVWTLSAHASWPKWLSIIAQEAMLTHWVSFATRKGSYPSRRRHFMNVVTVIASRSCGHVRVLAVAVPVFLLTPLALNADANKLVQQFATHVMRQQRQHALRFYLQQRVLCGRHVRGGEEKKSCEPSRAQWSGTFPLLFSPKTSAEPSFFSAETNEKRTVTGF